MILDGSLQTKYLVQNEINIIAVIKRIDYFELDMEMTFVADFEILGKIETVDLKEGGKDIDVTEAILWRKAAVKKQVVWPTFHTSLGTPSGRASTRRDTSSSASTTIIHSSGGGGSGQVYRATTPYSR